MTSSSENSKPLVAPRYQSIEWTMKVILLMCHEVAKTSSAKTARWRARLFLIQTPSAGATTRYMISARRPLMMSSMAAP